MKYLNKDELIIGKAYECIGRNLTKGVWNGKGFEYVRTKFGTTFPDIEYHWDDGPPYGTVKPLKEAEPE